MLVFLAVCLVLLLTVTPSESAPAPAPAPFTVEALLAANLLGLAGLKGNIRLRNVHCNITFVHVNCSSRISDWERSRGSEKGIIWTF